MQRRFGVIGCHGPLSTCAAGGALVKGGGAPQQLAVIVTLERPDSPPVVRASVFPSPTFFRSHLPFLLRRRPNIVMSMYLMHECVCVYIHVCICVCASVSSYWLPRCRIQMRVDVYKIAIRIAVIKKTPPLVQVNQSRTATLCVVFKPPLPVSIGGFSKLKHRKLLNNFRHKSLLGTY